MTNRTLDKNALLDLLNDAQDHLQEAVSLLHEFVNQTDDVYTGATLLAHLRIMASSDHSYLTDDESLDDLIEQVKAAEFDEVE